jgi:hypothetical protein
MLSFSASATVWFFFLVLLNNKRVIFLGRCTCSHPELQKRRLVAIAHGDRSPGRKQEAILFVTWCLGTYPLWRETLKPE